MSPKKTRPDPGSGQKGPTSKHFTRRCVTSWSLWVGAFASLGGCAAPVPDTPGTSVCTKIFVDNEEVVCYDLRSDGSRGHETGSRT